MLGRWIPGRHTTCEQTAKLDISRESNRYPYLLIGLALATSLRGKNEDMCPRLTRLFGRAFVLQLPVDWTSLRAG